MSTSRKRQGTGGTREQKEAELHAYTEITESYADTRPINMDKSNFS